MKRADAEQADRGGAGRGGKKTKWMPRRPGNPKDLNASVMEQLSWRVSDMLQPL